MGRPGRPAPAFASTPPAALAVTSAGSTKWREVSSQNHRPVEAVPTHGSYPLVADDRRPTEVGGAACPGAVQPNSQRNRGSTSRVQSSPRPQHAFGKSFGKSDRNLRDIICNVVFATTSGLAAART
jgi:hypothetical protein